MVQKKTVKRNKSITKHIKSRNKKIIQTQRMQNKIEGWDKQQSFSDNLKRLGINNMDVNGNIKQMSKEEKEQPMPVIEAEEMTLEQIRKLNSNPNKKDKVKLTVDEEWAIEGLVKKHKTDWNGMKFDHKTNTFQWTAVQC